MGNRHAKHINPTNEVPPPNEKPDNLFYLNNRCNYHCPVCKKTGKVPNIAGKFFLINDTECKCNACNSVFPKSQFYKVIVDNASPI
jgi:hypothetical protein